MSVEGPHRWTSNLLYDKCLSLSLHQPSSTFNNTTRPRRPILTCLLSLFVSFLRYLFVFIRHSLSTGSGKAIKNYFAGKEKRNFSIFNCLWLCSLHSFTRFLNVKCYLHSIKSDIIFLFPFLILIFHSTKIKKSTHTKDSEIFTRKIYRPFLPHVICSNKSKEKVRARKEELCCRG